MNAQTNKTQSKPALSAAGVIAGHAVATRPDAARRACSARYAGPGRTMAATAVLAWCGLLLGCGSGWVPGAAPLGAPAVSAAHGGGDGSQVSAPYVGASQGGWATGPAHAAGDQPSELPAGSVAGHITQLFLPLPLDSHPVAHRCDVAQGCEAALSWSDFMVADDLPHLVAWLYAEHPMISHGLALARSADGRTLAVGVPAQRSTAQGALDASIPDGRAAGLGAEGAVHLYHHAGNGWVRQATLHAPVLAGGQQFGRSVALSADGQSLAVGAAGEGPEIESGAAYVFERTGGQWLAQAQIQPSGLRPGDAFGSGVALSADGRVLAVGAPGDARPGPVWSRWLHGGNDPNTGAAYVFERVHGHWVQHTRVTAAEPQAHALFGYAVALSPDGSRLAVAAVGQVDRSEGSDGYRGSVHAYTRNGKAWNGGTPWAAPRDGRSDFLGHGVAVSNAGQGWVVGSVVPQPVASRVASATGAGGSVR